MTQPTRKQEAPTPSLPDLISKLEAVNELLESNEEGELSYVGRRDLQEKRNRLAEQIAELESGKARKAKGNPSQREAARRARRNARFGWRTDEERVDRLKSMAADDGTDASDFLNMLVDGEWRHREELGRKRKRSA